MSMVQIVILKIFTMDVIQIVNNYLKETWFLMLDMSFWLLIGFFMAGMIYLYINENFIARFLKKNNFNSVINSALFGVPLPLCSCGVIPVGVSLYNNGVSKSSTISFLISTPQTGVDSIMVTYSLLGLPFAIIRPIIAFLTGIAGGIVSLIINKDLSEKDNSRLKETINIHNNNDKNDKKDFLYAIKYGFGTLLSDISKYLIIGILVAGLIGLIVPDDFFTSYIKNNTLEMFVILIASIPIYVCATSSVPIAAMLLMKGLSPGAVLVFLMAGPATNAATINVISRIMGRKSLLIYLGTIIFSTLLFGYIINNLLPAEWFYNNIKHVHVVHGNHILPLWLRYISAIILTFLLLKEIISKIIQRNQLKQLKTKYMADYKIVVKGMTCNHCKMTVEKSIKEITGIENVNADPLTGIVEIKGKKIDENILKEKIEKAGYIFQGFKN